MEVSSWSLLIHRMKFESCFWETRQLPLLSRFSQNEKHDGWKQRGQNLLSPKVSRGVLVWAESRRNRDCNIVRLVRVMKCAHFSSCILLAVCLWIVGCSTPKPVVDPLTGWKYCYSDDPARSNKTIENDYQDYIKTLAPEKRSFTSSVVKMYEDGTGQHAVKIMRGVNGTWWEHILIYDRDNNRIKVYKYPNGGYRS